MFEYDPHITVNDMRIDNVKVRKPMPAKQELLQRNSFPSVNDNKHLTDLLKRGRRNERETLFSLGR